MGSSLCCLTIFLLYNNNTVDVSYVFSFWLCYGWYLSQTNWWGQNWYSESLDPMMLSYSLYKTVFSSSQEKKRLVLYWNISDKSIFGVFESSCSPKIKGTSSLENGGGGGGIDGDNGKVPRAWEYVKTNSHYANGPINPINHFAIEGFCLFNSTTFCVRVYLCVCAGVHCSQLGIFPTHYWPYIGTFLWMNSLEFDTVTFIDSQWIGVISQSVCW